MTSAVYCGDYTALATTRYGDKIYVDTRDTSLAPHIMLDGVWEPWVSDNFVTFLKRCGVCSVIDVGANFGWYTLLANRFGLVRQVLAFEPNTRLTELLQATLSVNGYTRTTSVMPVACGRTSDCGFLNFTRDALGGGTVNEQPLVRAPRSVTEAAAIVPLDNWSHGELGDPGLLILKIDVEGAECNVLAGAQRLLEQHKPTIYIEHHKDNVRALWQLLEGYSIHHVLRTGFLGPPLIAAAAEQIDDAETFFCVPPR